MIEINLTPGEQRKDFTKIGGVDFGYLNFKLLVPALILFFSVETIVDTFYADKIRNFESMSLANDQKIRTISAEVRKYSKIKKQIEDLNQQEKSLAAKINIVKEIVDKRQNPFQIFRYIAENTPKDVWIDELELDLDVLSLKGKSKSWKSIGVFIENLKSSIFFDGTIDYQKPPINDPKLKSLRVEAFEIKTKIVSFK